MDQKEWSFMMNFGSDEVTIAGFIITWLGVIFGYIRTFGRMTDTVDLHSKKIEAIEKTFFTIEGEPRLMSYAAHDQISKSCRDLINERIGHSTDRLDKQEKVLDEIREGVNELRGIIRQRSNDQGVPFGRRRTDTE